MSIPTTPEVLNPNMFAHVILTSSCMTAGPLTSSRSAKLGLVMISYPASSNESLSFITGSIFTNVLGLDGSSSFMSRARKASQ